MPRIQQHTHKLKRHRYKSTGSAVFFCVLDCGFKVDQGLALGKKTICWRCGNETPINEYSIRLAKPICMGCVKHKTDKKAASVETLAAPVAEAASTSLSDRLKNITVPAFDFNKDEDL